MARMNQIANKVGLRPYRFAKLNKACEQVSDQKDAERPSPELAKAKWSSRQIVQRS